MPPVRRQVGLANSPCSAAAVAFASGPDADSASACRTSSASASPSELQIVEHDVAVGQRAGLVQAHDVDPGQPLDSGQLLHQGLPPGQRHGRDHEREARQQHQALGHHADERGHRAGDGVLPGLVVRAAELAPQQERTDDEHDERDPAQQRVRARATVRSEPPGSDAPRRRAWWRTPRLRPPWPGTDPGRPPRSIRTARRRRAPSRSGSDSPVSSDSSISSPADSCTTPSARTWSPARSSSRSSATTAPTSTSVTAPSRTTRARGALSTASRSSVRFARTS